MKIIQSMKNLMAMNIDYEGVEIECHRCGEEVTIKEDLSVCLDILYREGWNYNVDGKALCPDCVADIHYNSLTKKEKKREKETFESDAKKWRE